MVCYEATLAKAGIQNIAEEKRREKILTERTAKVEKTGRQMPLIISGFQQLCWNTGKNNSPAISAALRFPAHRQIHQMAAMFSLADPPPRRPAAHPEETLCHAMTFTRTPLVGW